VDFDEILYGRDDFEDDLDFIIFHSFSHSKLLDVETYVVGAKFRLIFLLLLQLFACW
jgi:hypothetical protein